ncbi:MAG: hypothetical protein LBL52_03600 [Rickettsiales bacterium]|nr:hypothetical protein [Rickettsiales bacterium]
MNTMHKVSLVAFALIAGAAAEAALERGNTAPGRGGADASGRRLGRGGGSYAPGGRDNSTTTTETPGINIPAGTYFNDTFIELEQGKEYNVADLATDMFNTSGASTLTTYGDKAISAYPTFGSTAFCGITSLNITDRTGTFKVSDTAVADCEEKDIREGIAVYTGYDDRTNSSSGVKIVDRIRFVYTASENTAAVDTANVKGKCGSIVEKADKLFGALLAGTIGGGVSTLASGTKLLSGAATAVAKKDAENKEAAVEGTSVLSAAGKKSNDDTSLIGGMGLNILGTAGGITAAAAGGIGLSQLAELKKELKECEDAAKALP